MVPFSYQAKVMRIENGYCTYTLWLLCFPNHGGTGKFKQLSIYSSQAEQFFKTTLISLPKIKTLTKIHCFDFLVTA